ncbi:MAG: DUF2851 family protein [Flavobacteriaceae bacterium]|nr:DUF2851 family protein [Flavobacteriaceae bacterium]
MRENFLHYLWKFKKFNTLHLFTTENKPIQLINVGTHNFNSGPDFLNALVKIDEQLWAGNIEIHIKSSDWFQHGHESDVAYNNVILHVVWEHDAAITRSDNSVIPTLELKSYIDAQVLSNYYRLFNGKRNWINCETDFASIDDMTLQNWLERLHWERLERKCKEIDQLLESTRNDWDTVCFKLMAKNFGLHINADAFLSVANSIDFAIVRKMRADRFKLEALFFGQAGLLEEALDLAYYNDLKNEYQFLRQKFRLNNAAVVPVKFLRLRPNNFPTIRLSQLANLYHGQDPLFSAILKSNTITEFYNLFQVGVSPFWRTHYSFQRKSRSVQKDLSKKFIDLIIINAIMPLKFSYERSLGKTFNSELLTLIKSIDYELNTTTRKFYQMKKISKTAMHSQALLQLKNEYCNKNKCLQCAIGNALLNRNM